MIQKGCFTSEGAVFQPGSEFQTPRCAAGPARSPKEPSAARLMVLGPGIPWVRGCDTPGAAGREERQHGRVPGWASSFPREFPSPPNPPSYFLRVLEGQTSSGWLADALPHAGLARSEHRPPPEPGSPSLAAPRFQCVGRKASSPRPPLPQLPRCNDLSGPRGWTGRTGS